MDMTALLIGALSVACGVMGGVFFAFSTFALRSLGALPAAAGIRAMQSMNIVAVTPVFMTALFGTAVAAAGTAAYAATAGIGTATLPVVGGAAIYLVGVIIVTIAGNVPLNNGLAAIDPDAGDALFIWTRYRRKWLAWNHLRTVSGILASAWFAYALRVLESA